MSNESLPAPNGQHKPVVFLSEEARIETLMRLSEAKSLSTDTLKLLQPPCDAHPVRQESPATYSPIDLTLHSIQAFGFTHPSSGLYLMVPKEFQAILARESKAVAAVIWEVMQQTIGWNTGREPGGQREWARLSVRHFARDKILSCDQAQRGITRALKKGYITRRRSGPQGYEYQLRWRGTN